MQVISSEPCHDFMTPLQTAYRVSQVDHCRVSDQILRTINIWGNRRRRLERSPTTQPSNFRERGLESLRHGPSSLVPRALGFDIRYDCITRCFDHCLYRTIVLACYVKIVLILQALVPSYVLITFGYVWTFLCLDWVGHSRWQSGFFVAFLVLVGLGIDGAWIYLNPWSKFTLGFLL